MLFRLFLRGADMSSLIFLVRVGTQKLFLLSMTQFREGLSAGVLKMVLFLVFSFIQSSIS
jgi:hypothetical protein